ncbi:MAG: insulinase family protein [Myxococcales bacterium]|nr:insulinase family protein [Myxococcales bacterium]
MRMTHAPNGITVLVEKNPASRAVALQVGVRVGSADEELSQLGLAHIHEHMLFKGTGRRRVGEIAAEIEAAGGDINAYTSYDATVYHATLSGRFFELGLDVLSDAIQRSAFDEAELGRELEVIVEEIRRSDDTPGRVASKLYFRTAFHVHPYGRPVIGSEASVRSQDRAAILRFFNRWYRPENLIVSAVGDLDEGAATDAILRAFESTSAGGTTRAPRAMEPEWRGLRFARQTSRFTQGLVNIGFPAPALTHPDVPALDVIALVLGQGESSRLYRTLHRDTGLVNGISASAYTPLDPGLFTVSANLPAGDARGAVSEIFAQLARFTETLVDDAELDKARAIFRSQRIYEQESVGGRARRLLTWPLHGRPPESEDEYLRAALAVTPEGLREVARRWFDPDAFVATALVPEADGAPDGLDEAVFAEAARAVSHHPRPRSAAPAHKDHEHRDAVEILDLPGGGRLVVARDSSVPLVSVRALTVAGLGYEAPGNGATRLLAETLCRGTGTRTGTEIAALMDGMAGVLEAGAGRHSFGLRSVLLAEHLGPGLDLFFDVLTGASLPTSELERERGLQLEAIRSEADRPASYAMRLLMETAYAGHPYGASYLGTAASVAAQAREPLLALRDAILHPSRLVFAVVGDVEPDAIQRRFADAMTQHGASPTAPLTPPGAPEPKAASLRRESIRGAQAHLAFHYPGLVFGDVDRPALDVLTAVLSGQGGRLFLELRDKLSLAYTVSCSSAEGRDVGWITAYIGTSPEKVDTALAGMRRELGRIAQDVIDDAELDRARRYLIGSWDVGHERRSARASTLAAQIVLNSPFRRLSDYPDAIATVSAADVLRVAQRLLRPEHETVVIVSP